MANAHLLELGGEGPNRAGRVGRARRHRRRIWRRFFRCSPPEVQYLGSERGVWDRALLSEPLSNLSMTAVRHPAFMSCHVDTRSQFESIPRRSASERENSTEPSLPSKIPTENPISGDHRMKHGRSRVATPEPLVDSSGPVQSHFSRGHQWHRLHRRWRRVKAANPPPRRAQMPMKYGLRRTSPQPCHSSSTLTICPRKPSNSV